MERLEVTLTAILSPLKRQRDRRERGGYRKGVKEKMCVKASRSAVIVHDFRCYLYSVVLF